MPNDLPFSECRNTKSIFAPIFTGRRAFGIFIVLAPTHG
jgi:hypothetical protein